MTYYRNDLSVVKEGTDGSSKGRSEEVPHTQGFGP